MTRDDKDATYPFVLVTAKRENQIAGARLEESALRRAYTI